LSSGQSQWVTFDGCDDDEKIFPTVKAAFEEWGSVTVGKVGSATAKLMSQRALVDFAVQWWYADAPTDSVP